MANYIVTTEELTDIADAIRMKTGGSETYKFNQLANGIKNIPQEGSGGTQGSKYIPLSVNLINFETDPRFEIEESEKPWSIQDLFTYKGINMYSAFEITHSQESIWNIKNVSDKCIFMKCYYQASTERDDCDYAIISTGGVIDKNNIGGTITEEDNKYVYIALNQNSTLTLKYCTDYSTLQGKNNVGLIFYEFKE